MENIGRWIALLIVVPELKRAHRESDTSKLTKIANILAVWEVLWIAGILK